jgi:C4-dicarboxylate-specific signal transduction histidine kinase
LAKSRTRGRKLRSIETKKKAHGGRARKTRADLERQLEVCGQELACTQERLTEATMQLTATSDMWHAISSLPIRPAFDAVAENTAGFRDTNNTMFWRLDLTERKRTAEAFRQLGADLAHMNRLSMMGELSASLAHEITQPIATARNNARAALNFLEREPVDLSEVREALGCIVDDTDRVGSIIDRIRDQVKKAPPRKHRFDLNEAINEVIGLARSAITKNGVLVQTSLTREKLLVDGDRVQLQQVVLNLLLNAVEAMGSVPEGSRELSVSSGDSETDGVLVAVCDSGPGIEPDHLELVFETFYTTKPSGVGMGLSICRSIIDAHGGRLWAGANEPRGAVLRFTLPAATEQMHTHSIDHSAE